MAAVFPLDTTKPWTFNGVTYEYDATEDRWFFVSTTKTDAVDNSLEELTRGLDITNTVIDQEIENRSNLLDAAASKNNQQDSSITEINFRLDALASSAGTLEFKGKYEYVALKTTAGCQSEYEQCLRDAENSDDVSGARSECSRSFTQCTNSLGQPLADATFSTTGADDLGGPSLLFELQESITITDVSAEGSSFDWHNVLEIGDFIELVETTKNDTVLYEVITDPVTRNGSEEIRIKYIKSENLGDGQFNYDEVYEIRAFRAKQGLDINEADQRYVSKPYVVYFEDSPADITPVHSSGELRNGELWFDTSSLQMFVWNNNAWVGTAPPPSQDVVITEALADIESLQAKPDITSSTTAPANPKQGDLWFNPSTLKFAFYTAGAWVNPDQS